MLPGWDRLQDLRGGREPVKKPDAITQAVADAADKLTTARVLIQTARAEGMERLKEKLAKASGVATRMTAEIEAEADKLIAREDTMRARKSEVFGQHHSVLDDNNRGLNQLEDALKMVGNGLPNSEG